MARKTLTTAQILKANGLGGFEHCITRILGYWNRATAADAVAGASWYGEDSGAVLRELVAAGAPSLAHAAAGVSHLSPRTSWKRNVGGARLLFTEGPEAAAAMGCMAANVARAAASMVSDEPLDTFGPDAHKTRAFARNLLGDRDAVTVDVWAARVAMGLGGRDAEKILKRAGVYAAIAAAYREAAKRAGTDATTMQATTWIVARNGRAL